MKKSISLALMALLAVSFVACGGDDHKHSYSKDWTFDATNHWHAATCSHEDKTSGLAAHSGGTATCVDKAECEVCGAEYGDVDATNHVDLNEIGDCVDCGADVSDPTFETVAEALEFGVARGGLVTNGTLVSTSYTPDSEDGYVIDDVTYELAENYAKLAKKDNEGLIDTYWYVGYGEDGNVLPLVYYSWSTSASKQYIDPLAEMVNGYCFETPFNYSDSYYGVEEFVAAIYGLVEAPVENEVEAGYSFSVSYINENGAKYDATVNFTFNKQFIMDSVNIEIKRFYKTEMTDENGEYVTDDNGDIVYGYAEVEDSKMVYEITQAISETAIVKDYVAEDVLVSSYTLKDGENEVTELALVAGEAKTLTLADIPETANAKLDTFTVSVVDANGEEVEDAISNYFNAYGEVPTIEFTGTLEGAYTVTITSAFVTKTIDVTVTAPETTEIFAGKNEWAKLTATEIYTDGSLSFGVFANEYADASATVTCEDENATITENQGTYTFVSEVPGTYTVTVTSTANADLDPYTFTVTVKDVPDVTEFFDNDMYQNQGKSDDDSLMIWFMTSGDTTQFIATYEGVEFNYETWTETSVKYAAAYNFEYNEDTKAITISDMDGAADLLASMYEGYTPNQLLISAITMNEDYTMTVMYMNDMATLEAYVEPSAIDDVAGEYKMMVGTYGEDDYGRWLITLNNDGTGAMYNQIYNPLAFRWTTGDQIIEFEYTVGADYSIVISNVTVPMGEGIVGFDLDTVNSTIAWSEVTGLSFTFNGEACVFERN